MSFSIARLAVIAVALFGAINVSAAPVEHELETRALAQVITKCTKAKTVALTFDDGPYINNKKLVDLLNANGAKGTFFFNGNNYGCIYDSANAARVKYAYDKGHQIASHTWSHAHLKTLSGSALTSEFSKTDTAIKKITGAVPAFMRPPYGEYDDEVRTVAASRGQKVVIWDFDSGDSAGKSAAYKSLIAKKPNNILTLNHETYATTVNDVIPDAIKQLKAAGYKLVTVAECLGQSPYKSTGSPAARDSTWKC
ncbi:carbohydrate esterase family 4 protein [Ceratobasidium sp. AG-I]|nr:carbohydrate esterase family 4 protein [Ceratobasidium sp. AG-I]